LTEKHGQVYDFSSTQINLPDDLAKKAMDFGKTIPDDELKVENDEGKGREDDIHVTVLYGLHAEKPDQVKKLIKDIKPFEITLGKVSAFETNKEFDVVKIEVESPELRKLNKLLSDKCENSNSYPDYHPHVTIAYVKKGNAKKYIGNKSFVGKTFKATEITFSSKNGSRIALPFAD